MFHTPPAHKGEWTDRGLAKAAWCGLASVWVVVHDRLTFKPACYRVSVYSFMETTPYITTMNFKPSVGVFSAISFRPFA